MPINQEQSRIFGDCGGHHNGGGGDGDGGGGDGGGDGGGGHGGGGDGGGVDGGGDGGDGGDGGGGGASGGASGGGGDDGNGGGDGDGIGMVKVPLPEKPDANWNVSSVHSGADHSAPSQPSYGYEFEDMYRVQAAPGGAACASGP